MITKNIDGNTLTQAFIDAITDSSTPYLARLIYNGSPVQCDIKSITITKGTVAAMEGFNVGAVISSEMVAEVMNLSAALKDKVVEVQIGLITNESLGTVEYIEMGEFVISTAEQTAYMTTLIGYGYTVGKTGGTFTSPQDLTPPQALTLANIAAQIESGAGVTITWDPGIDTTAELTLPLSGITNYQALQILASVTGGYAIDTNVGNIHIGLFDDTITHNISAGLMINLPQYEEQDFEITGVYVNTAAGAIGSQTAINLVTDSQWLTADMFSDYESNIVGYTYRPATCGLTIGDPRIEGSDVLQVTNIDGTAFVMPCHKVVHRYTGGLTSNIQSAVATQLENAIATPPPLSEQVGEAVSKANEALEKAEEAAETSEYFWHTTSDTGFGAGAHITQKPQVDVLADPDNAGGNTLITSEGVKIRDGLTELAKFLNTGVVIGDESQAHSTIGEYSQVFYGYDGVTEVARIGSTRTSLTNVPNATFGTRREATNDYDSSLTYKVGDLVRRYGFDYVCTEDITVPEAFTYSHWTSVIGERSVAEGLDIVASGRSSHAEGEFSSALGWASHAEGRSRAYGDYSHAEGILSTASGRSSHAEGYSSGASGLASHAEGDDCNAYGDYSHAQNSNTTAYRRAQTAIGEWNITDTRGADFTERGKFVLIIGNGTGVYNMSNAMSVDWDGNIYAQGMAGMIQMFAGATAPSGWLMCDGSVLDIDDYPTLFNVIGNTYGGDGVTTFALPNMVDRFAVGAGNDYALNAKGGEKTHTLTSAESGQKALSISGGGHSHQPSSDTNSFLVMATSGNGITRNTVASGSGATYYLRSPDNAVSRAGYTNSTTHSHSVSASDASSAHENRPPYIAINYIICTGKTD